MDRIEDFNLAQIEMLNQRGGRALSIVDLVNARTLSAEMAAYALCAVAGGSSIITAARPGGAGKTTLMAALLAFLPPGEKLRTVGAGASRVPRGHSDHGAECLLSHEIGRGHYFGYVWAAEAHVFFQALRRGVRIASNIHADDLDDLFRELTAPDIDAGPFEVDRLDLIVFMAMRQGADGPIRRVSALHGPRHALLWQWDEASDQHVWRAEGSPQDHLPAQSPVRFEAALGFIEHLASAGVTVYAEVRAQTRGFLESMGRSGRGA